MDAYFDRAIIVKLCVQEATSPEATAQTDLLGALPPIHRQLQATSWWPPTRPRDPWSRRLGPDAEMGF